MSVLATFMPVTITREKAVEIADTFEIAETTGINGAGQDDQGDEYLRINFVQVLYIQYPITF